MAIVFNYILLDIAVAAVTCFVALYLYYANAFRYWKRRGVHYIEPTSFFGNLGSVALQKEHLGQYLKKVYDSNPTQPVVGLFAMKTPMLMIRNLDVVRSVMVKDAHSFIDRSLKLPDDELPSNNLFVLKGKKWRHMRIKLTPTFTSGKIKMMFSFISECGKQLVPCIDREISKGNGVVVKDTVARYSTDVIASCAFGVNADALSDPKSEFRENTRKIFEPTKLQSIVISIMIFAPWLVRMLRLKRYDDCVNTYIRKTFWDVVEYRQKNKVVRKDFVDIMMQMKNEGHVRAEDAKDLAEIKQDSKYLDTGNSHSDTEFTNLDDDVFVAQAFIFIAAGYETSSSVISFTLYELALNPAVQDKLRGEIQAVLDKYDSEVSYDAILEMEYLEMVVSEAMRKYPTLPVLDRKCVADFKIPGTDITIEKETKISIPLLAIHLDPSIYPEPEKFDPERFSPANKSKRSNFAHMPFGEGPRICIGMRFGQMQVKTALVYLLTSYQVKPCEQTPQPPLEMKPASFVNSPQKDIVLAFEKIK